MKTLKILAGLVVGLVALTVVVLLALPSLMGSDRVKAMIASRVEAQTGRTLILEGDVTFSLWPKIRFHTGPIALGNAAGFAQTPFFSLDEFEVAIATWPLIRGDYKMDVLKLHGPALMLEVKADGSNNWADLMPVPEAGEATSSSSESGALTNLPALALGGVDIADGRLQLRDESRGQHLSLSGLSVQTGRLVLGEPVKVEMRVDGQSTQPELAGNLALDGEIRYDFGAERYQITPLALTSTLDGPTVPGGKATLALEAQVDAQLRKGVIELKGLSFTGPGAKVAGELEAFDINSKAPGAAGKVSINVQDLAALLGMFDLPIAEQLSAVANRGADIALDFNADMQAGELTVSRLEAAILGALVSGKLAGTRIDTNTPAISASLSAKGPDLPALLALGGAVSGNELLGKFGSDMASEPRRAFDIGVELDADLKSGRISARDLRADSLNVILRGALEAEDINDASAPISGNLTLEAPRLAPLLAAAGQPLVADVVSSVSVKANLNGSSEQVSLAPFTVRAGVGGPLIGTGPEVLELGADSATGNLKTEELQIKGLRLSGLGLALEAEINATDILSDPAANGRISLPTFNLRELASRLKIDLPPMADGSTLRKAGISTGFSGSARNAALSDLTVTLDESTLTGEIKLLDLATQDLAFDLALDRINLDRYMPPPASGAGRPAKGDGAKPITPETAAATAATELPLEMLRALKAEGRLRVGELTASKAKLSDVVVSLRARDGKIAVEPATAKLYEGAYQGTVNIDASTETPTIAVTSKLTDVALGPLLEDMEVTRAFGALGNIDIDVTAAGRDVAALERSVNGTATLSATRGVIRGFTGFAKMGEKLGGALSGSKAPRDLYFTGLSATAIAKDGIVTNDDFKLEAPLLRATGQGTLANLPARTLDYNAEVKIVGTLKGEDGASLTDLTGVPAPMIEQMKGIPIGAHIHGSFDKPATDLDWSRVMAAVPAGMLNGKLGGAGEALADPVSTAKKSLLKAIGIQETPPTDGAGTGTAEGSSGSTDGATSADTTAPAAAPPTEDEPETPEKALEDAAKGLLKGLF